MKILILAAAAALTLSAADCDRKCLGDLVTKYVEALGTHKPESLPLADKVRFTEDSKELKLGEGFWKEFTKARAFRQDILDVTAGIAASHLLLEDAKGPVMFTLVLHVADQKITGVETLVTHNKAEGALFTPEGWESAPAGMKNPVPPGKRNTRGQLVGAAMAYPAGLEIGSFVLVDAPFVDDAYRLENGAMMAGSNCARPPCTTIKAQKITKHPGLMASVTAVDEEQGIVLLWMNFGNQGAYGAGNALTTYEAFKVWGGEIHAVQAFIKILPEATRRGWSN